MDKIKTRAENNAYSLLRVRPRSEREIRERLKLKGYNDSIIDDVVEGLKRRSDIDDGKFAKFWVDSRMHLNPVGDIVLKHELKDKGIEDSIIESALETKAEAYDEYEVAFNMAAEKFERLKKLDRRKASKRIYDFLLRRGFKYDTIRKIIGTLVKQPISTPGVE